MFTKQVLLLIGVFSIPLSACSSSSCCSSDDAGGSADRSRLEAALVDRLEARPADLEGATPCPQFREAAEAGRVTFEEITEASGLAVSRRNSGVFWTHNDSGDIARVFAFDRQGNHLGVYRLMGVTAVDFEDMALGSGPETGKDYLYLGDIGDNNKVRKTVVVYRVEEPVVDAAGGAPVDMEIGPVDALIFSYPDGPQNAETLLLDPQQGDLYIVTKSTDGVSRIYRGASPHEIGSARPLTSAGTLTFGEDRLKAVRDNQVTSGDVAPDGSAILLRTYFDVLLWRRPANVPLEQALAGTPCTLPVALEPQGEAIAFDPQGKDYYTLSEKPGQPLYFFARQ